MNTQVKSIAIFLFLFILSIATAYCKNPYYHLKYDSVVMYSFISTKGAEPFILDKDGRSMHHILQKTSIDKQVVLNMHEYLGSKKSFGEPVSPRFEPNFGFVYYYQGVVVAQISICLEANRLVSSLELDAQKQGRVREGNHEYYIGEGLSYHFKSYLKMLVNKHQLILSHNQR